MHCGKTTFTYHNEFSEHMKVEGEASKDVFDYFIDARVKKFLSEKGKKYLLELFEKWDLGHLQLDEHFDYYSDNYGLEDIIRDESMQNINNDD